MNTPDTSYMTISVNNRTQDIPDCATVQQALEAMGIKAFNGMAVAIDNTIVKKENWPVYYLQPNDALVLIRASQGG